MDFAGAFPEDIYTWPTGFIYIVEYFDVTATDADGNVIVIALQVAVISEYGEVGVWDIR